MTAATRNGARAKPSTKAPARPKKAAKATKPASKAAAKPKAKPTKSRPGPNGLTDIEERFALEYIKDQNGVRAYKAIKPNVSDGSAGTLANRLLKKVQIQTFIAERTKTIANRMELSAERTMREIARLAYFDPRKLFDKDGRPLSLNELDDDTAAAIAGVEVVTVGNIDMGFGEVRKIKISDKNAALEKAAKILGLFEKDNAQAGNALGAALAKFVAQFHGKDAGRLKVSRG